MTWRYRQSSGEFFNPAGDVIATGYSGCGAGKNNPLDANLRDIGPLPVGHYDIGNAYDSLTHGPQVLALTPAPDNQMFGRTAFLIHGDSIAHPGHASHGCMILARPIREILAHAQDRKLEVVA